jgi:hypothetical protein
MKRLILISLLMICVSAYGQMLNKNYVWNDMEKIMTNCKSTECPNDFFYYTHSYHIGNDTVIKSKTYGIVIDSTYAAQGDSDAIISATIVGFVREEVANKKVFFMDINASEESILYDFSLNKKDSIVIIQEKGTLEICQIRDTVFKDYFGHKRLTIEFYRSLPKDSFAWIYGIGSSKGFLYTRIFNGTLLCVKNKNELLYVNDTLYGCIQTRDLTPIKEISETTDLLIFPNPASDRVTIQQNQNLNSIELFDLCGKELAYYKTYQTQYSITLTGYKSGVYFIKVGSRVRKLIIK